MAEETNTIRVREYGGPSVLQTETAPRPEPSADELLVRVHAAGVNRVDAASRRGQFIEYALPWIPGWDLSGIVEDVGESVTEFETGDAVYGLIRFPDPGNAYAEYASVPADEVVTKPDALDHTEAAGVPLVALTAWQALFEKGDLNEGDRILVHAAAGGVGHIAVQLAKWRGAHVIGTASGYNENFLRELGVDEFVNYRNERFEERVESVDVVLDAIGGETQERSFGVLKAGGVLVALTTEPSEELANEYGVRTQLADVRPNATVLAEISNLIETGAVAPTITTTRPLANAHAAHEEIEETHTRGKIVLRTDAGSNEIEK